MGRFVKSFDVKFHENPTNGLAFDTRLQSPTGRQNLYIYIYIYKVILYLGKNPNLETIDDCLGNYAPFVLILVEKPTNTVHEKSAEFLMLNLVVLRVITDFQVCKRLATL